MRKPVLAKVRERIFASLPNLPDSDLAHIASLCDGLLKLRAQQKQSALQSVKPRFEIRDPLTGQAHDPVAKESNEHDSSE